MMFLLAASLAAASAGAFAATGYLVGARKGRDARVALLADVASREQLTVQSADAVRRLEADLAAHRAELHTRNTELAARSAELNARNTELNARRAEIAARDAALATQQPSLTSEAIRREIENAVTPLVRRDEERARTMLAELQKLGSTMAKSAPDPEAFQRELRKTIAPLLIRDQETTGLRDMVRELVGPMVERQRLGRELSKIDSAQGSLTQLPALLDSMVEKGGFEAVIVSDDVGLPLAASRNAQDIEVHAGISALLLTLVDRVAASNFPAPVSFVIQDAAGRHVLHRIFRVGTERYTVSAVTRAFVAPSALDPAVARLERMLEKSEAA